MYLGYQNEKIKFYVEEILDSKIYPDIEWIETEDEYVLVDDEYILYDEIQKEKELNKAKEQKTQIAKDKAYDFLANGNALFEFEENKHIEATDGNIAKFSAYLMGFEKGLYEVVKWNTKEDENVELNFEQVAFILQGLARVQSDVWTYKYPHFLEQIKLAQTIEEVENIEIDYNFKPQLDDETKENNEKEISEEIPQENNKEELKEEEKEDEIEN